MIKKVGSGSGGLDAAGLGGSVPATWGECVVAKIRWGLTADDRELQALKVYAGPGVTEPPGILDLYAFSPSRRARRTLRRVATAD
ncbi:hypothetical protein ACFXKV_22660 [Streptomyces globisporus]|uniref:hypothetical protein n=1 Tax=Streptomyces globisporus TaxID=1908 RepID=UPI00363D0133